MASRQRRDAAALAAQPGVEELRVAEEELRQQTDELAAARESLEAERARYGDLFEFAPVAYLVTDLHGRILEANRAAAALLNVPQNFLVGKPLAAYVPPQDRRAFRRRLLAIAREGTAPPGWDLEVLARRSRGVRVEAVVRQSSTFGRGELRWTLTDVEQRKRAEDEIRRLNAELERRVDERSLELASERARLETVVQQLPGGVAIVEAPSGRIVMANEEATRLMRYAIPAGSTIADYSRYVALRVDGSPYESDEWPLARSLARGEAVVGEVAEFVRGDGTRATLEITSAPIRDERGEITAAVVLFFDVSERESKERAEREFVTNAAHELQTPLAGIMSAVEVLQAGAKNAAADRDRFLEHIERECRRLDRLARALLLLARVQMRVERPRQELIHLRELLEQVAAELTPAREVRVEVDCPPDLALLASPELATQLLANLASNAAKFTVRGRIVLRAYQADDREVAVEVEDTGPGIPASERKRVFERFYRASAPTTGGGVGLGLAIAKAAADALGGSLELGSTPGEGTTMRVRLPGATLVRR